MTPTIPRPTTCIGNISRPGLYSKGIDGWWIDSTEPDVVNALTKEAEEYEMKRIGVNHLGSWAQISQSVFAGHDRRPL